MYIFIILLSICHGVFGNFTVDMQRETSWQNSGESFAYYKGYCQFQLAKPKNAGELKVNLQLSKPTSNLQIWTMNVDDNPNNTGKLYKLSNKWNIAQGTFKFVFIFTYDGDQTQYPTGKCAVSGVLPTTTMSPTSPVITTAPNSQNPYDYKKIIENSILFYEAQRSGNLTNTNTRIAWRGNSALGDGGSVDLTGGWYDAGDHVKFNLPMSSSTTNLALGLILWKDAYQNAGQLNYMYDSIKWPLDYFLKCWRASENKYYSQVGNGTLDHAYWGRAEDMNMPRPAFFLDKNKKGSDVTGGTAASLAAGYLAFKDKDVTYASELLDNSKSLYEFAKSIKGLYNDYIPVSGFYNSTEHYDELCVSGALLYWSTNEKRYLDEAKTFYTYLVHSGIPWAFSWDNQKVLCEALLFNLTKDTSYKTKVNDFVTSFQQDVTKTPCGLAYRNEWGSLRYSANAAFIALLGSEFGVDATDNYKTWAMSQIHYMIGNNKNGFSYAIGYGNNYPLRPHHRSSSCPSPPATCGWNTYHSTSPNAHTLTGALVGGPDINDNYQDDRTDVKRSEVACDYNAGFQSAVAGLLHFQINNNLPPAPPLPPTCK